MKKNWYTTVLAYYIMLFDWLDKNFDVHYKIKAFELKKKLKMNKIINSYQKYFPYSAGTGSKSINFRRYDPFRKII